MNKTVRFVLKMVAVGLAFAAIICLVIGSWNELMESADNLKERLRRKSEYEDYADEELYGC